MSSSVGLRSTLARDGALLVGSVVASTAVSVVASPALAVLKAQLGHLLQLFGLAQAGRSKFAVDFFWGGVERMLMGAFLSPFRVFDDGYRFASIAAIVFDGAAAPVSISEYAADLYADGGLAAFCQTKNVLLLNGLRYFPRQALNFAVKDKIKRVVPKYSPKSDFWKFLASNTASGGLSGACSLLVVYPLDNVRTKIEIARLRCCAKVRATGSTRAATTSLSRAPGPLSALDDKLVRSRTLVEAVGHVYREQGFFAMYSGFGVSVAGIMAYRGPYFAVFDTLKDINPWKTDRGLAGMASKFVIAQTTAIAAGLCSFPMDVIRRGQMLAPEMSALEVASRVYDASGLGGFLTGFGLNVARTVSGAIWLVIVDVAKKRLKQKAA